MDSIKCEAFLAAVDTGRMTEAAEKLGYTQSGVTRMIGSLEQELGFPLLLRSKRGVEPTENGHLMIPYLREFVRAEQNIRDLSAAINGVLQGRLTIGSYYSTSALWLPPILKSFKEKYPGIKLSLKEGPPVTLLRWLAESAVDCCIFGHPGGSVSFDWIPIREDDLLVWVSGDSPRAGEKCFHVEDLSEETVIVSSPRLSDVTDTDRIFEKYRIRPKQIISTIDVYTSYKMVEAGLGVTIENRLQGSKWMGNVARLPLDPPEKIELGIAVQSLKTASPAVRRFIDCVLETCREQNL